MKIWIRRAGALVGCLVAAAVVSLPLAVERGLQSVRFDDYLGTLPVEVSLCHNGRSTLDTGVLGKVFWEQTGAFGLGACARATGPPAAGGSLATYVDPEFIRANVALINDPNTVVEAYTAKFRAESLNAIGRYLLVGTVLGGALIYVLLPWARMRIAPLASELVIGSVLLVVATCTSTLVAMRLFDQWSGDQEVNTYYAMPGNDRLGFDNPQALEVARQVKPFVEKNLERIREVADRYEVTAAATFATELAGKLTQVTPGEGEIVVLGEADPQGSLVGGRVREALYEQLVAAIGADSVALRVIAGDVTSNGTVAESTYVEAEAGIAPGIPIAAVGGDHDSEQTWQQMADNGIQVPDFGTVDVAGLKVSGANDREHKTLFGGLVLNDEGIGERELGEKLRDAVGDESQIVLLHQPVAAAGYLGLEDLTSLRGLSDDSRVPYEDGVPDVPPGIVAIGHLHETDGPWLLWNTDGEEVTWTLVDQLGTAGGVQNRPTFNEFSTPISAPLKPLSVRMYFLDRESQLPRGYTTITCSVAGICDIADRTDVGLAPDLG